MKSYQELTKEILKELPITGNIQEYFYNISKNEPERFSGLIFDENGHKPFSKMLESIIFDLKISDKI